MRNSSATWPACGSSPTPRTCCSSNRPASARRCSPSRSPAARPRPGSASTSPPPVASTRRHPGTAKRPTCATEFDRRRCRPSRVGTCRSRCLATATAASSPRSSESGVRVDMAREAPKPMGRSARGTPGSGGRFGQPTATQASDLGRAIARRIAAQAVRHRLEIAKANGDRPVSVPSPPRCPEAGSRASRRGHRRLDTRQPWRKRKTPTRRWWPSVYVRTVFARPVLGDPARRERPAVRRGDAADVE